MTHDPTMCGCSPQWRKAKGNGTCATCGGWLPGDRPAPLPWLRHEPIGEITAEEVDRV